MPNRAGESPAITEPLPGIRQVDETESTSRRETKRRLRSELGISGTQANRLLRSVQFLEASTPARPRRDFHGILDPTGETATRNADRDVKRGRP